MNCILYKKRRDFSPYVDSIGEEFSRQLAVCWQEFGKNQSEQTENTYWFQVKVFLKFVCECDSLAEFRNILKNKTTLPNGRETALWQNTLALYRSHLQTSYESRTANNMVTGVRAFFCNHLANRGVVPHHLQLEGFPYELGLGRHTTILSTEVLSTLGMSASDFQTFCEQLDEQDEDTSLDADIISLLTEAFLLAEGEARRVDRVDLAVQIISSRIRALEETASKLYFAFINDTSEVKQWLEDESLCVYADRLWELLNDSSLSVGDERKKTYEATLQDDPLQVMVVMLKRHNGGLYPQDKDDWYKKFAQRCRDFGVDLAQVKRRLGFDMYAMTCGYAFIVLETFGNADSIRKLKIDDLEDGVVDTQYTLNWQKPRAGAHSAMHKHFDRRPSDVVLSACTLTVEDVFKHQLECRGPFDGLVRIEDQDRLFIAWSKNNTRCDSREIKYLPSLPSGNTFNRHFKTLCDEASEGAWTATLKSLRGTKLLLQGLTSRDLMHVANLAQHQGLSSAGRYIHLVPEWLRREQNIRDFLEWMEALVTVDIEGFAQKVGIDEDAYRHRLTIAKEERAREVEKQYNQQFGGLHCVNPYQGVQLGTTLGVVCNKVQNCPTCPNRRGIFVLTQDNLVNVLHWNSELEQANALSLTEWRTWLVFTRLVIESIKGNPTHRALYTKAKELQEAQENPYRGVVPIKVVS